MPAIRGLEKKIPYSLFHEISGNLANLLLGADYSWITKPVNLPILAKIDLHDRIPKLV